MMNSKIHISLLAIAVFLLYTNFVGSITFAFLSDQSQTSGKLTAGIWADLTPKGCFVTLDVKNNTENVIEELKVVAGQKSHPKNNYTIIEEFEISQNISVNEAITHVFEVAHREDNHCNIQWVYFDIEGTDVNGNSYLAKEVKVKVHNPPGKVKGGNYSESYLEILLSDYLLKDKDTKRKKESEQEVDISSNEEEKSGSPVNSKVDELDKEVNVDEEANSNIEEKNEGGNSGKEADSDHDINDDGDGEEVLQSSNEDNEDPDEENEEND
ncbi:hypothetical protein [Bacillus sp. FJAT-45066]|uniref:hypothetical protein n=1 Tax=Bacillus sp. FJAT-45066 TaxID=2011010 RepID=UPI001596A784|nr:hypothetical protein [Bacillus sp. FJAT-45066]